MVDIFLRAFSFEGSTERIDLRSCGGLKARGVARRGPSRVRCVALHIFDCKVAAKQRVVLVVHVPRPDMT